MIDKQRNRETDRQIDRQLKGRDRQTDVQRDRQTVGQLAKFQLKYVLYEYIQYIYIYTYIHIVYLSYIRTECQSFAETEILCSRVWEL